VYGSPELFQLLATFGVMLVVRDAALWLWGPEDLLGPRAPGLAGSVQILGAAFPEYDLFLIVLGPAVLGILWLALNRTRWGTLVRAATADREMAGALGVDQARLFTGVFALGAFLAALGGGLQLPREPAQLFLDITVIADAFVVVVVGGMGSIPGAFLAALLIGEIKAFCVGLGDVSLLGVTLSLPKLTLVAESLVMAAVLIARPWGLLGRPLTEQRGLAAHAEPPLRPAGPRLAAAAAVAAVVLVAMPLAADDYTLVLAIDIFIFSLFAASLHLLMGPAGMASFGHAAYFGLGAYGAALLLKRAGFPMEAALVLGPALAIAAGAVFGWFCVRLSGVYLAMLTLAFAQIAWSAAIQWDAVTGGSNGIVGVWPSGWLASRPAFYLAALVLCGGSLLLIRRLVFAPYGYALRACRDAPLRAEAIGIDVDAFRWSAFVVAAGFAGLAGALYAFSKGSLSPETLSIGRSVDALVMVLLGGLHSLGGPIVGAALFTGLQDSLARHTEYWRGSLGVVVIALAIAFPHGIAGVLRGLARRPAGAS
jgi:branched-chain amino acid transport system permease protein